MVTFYSIFLKKQNYIAFSYFLSKENPRLKPLIGGKMCETFINENTQSAQNMTPPLTAAKLEALVLRLASASQADLPGFDVHKSVADLVSVPDGYPMTESFRILWEQELQDEYFRLIGSEETSSHQRDQLIKNYIAQAILAHYVAAVHQDKRTTIDTDLLVAAFNKNPQLMLYLARKSVLIQTGSPSLIFDHRHGYDSTSFVASEDLTFFAAHIDDVAACIKEDDVIRPFTRALLTQKEDGDLPYLSGVRTYAVDLLLETLARVAGEVGKDETTLTEMGYLMDDAADPRDAERTARVLDRKTYAGVLEKLGTVWLSQQGFKAYLHALRVLDNLYHPREEKVQALLFPLCLETPDTIQDVSRWFVELYEQDSFDERRAFLIDSYTHLLENVILPSQRLPLYGQLYKVLDLSHLLDKDSSLSSRSAIVASTDPTLRMCIENIAKHAMVMTAYALSGEKVNELLQDTARVIQRALLPSESWQRVEAIYKEAILDVQSGRIPAQDVCKNARAALSRYARRVTEDCALVSYAQKHEDFSRTLPKDFIAKRDAHIRRLVTLYTPEIIQYGFDSKDPRALERRLSGAARRMQTAFLERREEIAEHYPVEALFDLYDFIGLNAALVTGVVKFGGLSRDELSFFETYVQNSSRFAVPFDIEKLHETGYHAGKVTGYYKVTVCVPLLPSSKTPYKGVASFAKIFKDRRAQEHEVAMHELAERLRNPVPRMLFSDRNIVLYEYTDDRRLRDVFAEELQ